MLLALVYQEQRAGHLVRFPNFHQHCCSAHAREGQLPWHERVGRSHDLG
jgi:hypothetical protein